MTELTERVARLEGAYDHLATKADLGRDFTGQIQEVKKSLNRLQRGIAVLGIVVIILQLWIKFTS